MQKAIGIEEFLELRHTLPVVDVRTPAEFEKAHIPGAFNIPLFSNHQRAQVGTSYKQQGKTPAVLLGLELVGTKLRGFAEKALELAKDQTILVHCWRGGMRSQSMAWLFSAAGLIAYTLEGGYKAYRNYIRQSFERKIPVFVLGGMTGSGKTELLYEMQKQGAQMIDLEGLAHHKGSSFGALGQEKQPSTEQFQNDLFDQWQKLDFQKTLWLEDESMSIGKVFIPDPVFAAMRNSPVIKIEVGKNTRIQRLLREYAGFEKEKLANSVQRIRKRLGNQHAKATLQAIEEEDFEKVADITLNYYDKAYLFGLSKRKKETIFPISLEMKNIRADAQKVLQLAEQIGKKAKAAS